ncbi:hypothetical protein SANTM175S_04888 [Streptomyces antimycoticus]
MGVESGLEDAVGRSVERRDDFPQKHGGVERGGQRAAWDGGAVDDRDVGDEQSGFPRDVHRLARAERRTGPGQGDLDLAVQCGRHGLVVPVGSRGHHEDTVHEFEAGSCRMLRECKNVLDRPGAFVIVDSRLSDAHDRHHRLLVCSLTPAWHAALTTADTSSPSRGTRAERCEYHPQE